MWIIVLLARFDSVVQLQANSVEGEKRLPGTDTGKDLMFLCLFECVQSHAHVCSHTKEQLLSAVSERAPLHSLTWGVCVCVQVGVPRHSFMCTIE